MSQDFIQSEGCRVKRKGLSYKDVRRPFIVFNGGGGKIYSIFLKIFTLIACLIRMKSVYLQLDLCSKRIINFCQDLKQLDISVIC